MKTLRPFLLAIFISMTFVLPAQTSHFIYVSDAGGFNSPPWQVLRYDLDGSNPQVFISNETFVSNNVGWPQDILFLEDQNVVLISCLIGNRITKHHATTGAYIEDFAAVPGGPTRMKIGPDGLIYVVQWSTSDNRVLQFEQDGTPLGEYTNTGVARSVGLDIDNAGNLYVGSYGGNTVTKFDADGNSEGVLIDTQLAGPTNVILEQGGNILALNWNGGTIERFDSGGNHIETFTTAVTQPEGFAIHPTNFNYLVGNGGPAQIDEFLFDGTFVGSVVSSGSGGLVQPNAVVIRDANKLGIEDTILSKVKVAPTVGDTFRVNNTLESLRAIKVFDTTGKLIKNLVVSKELIWNASHIEEGIYFMVFTSEDGAKATQKLIVRH